ncbi:hypothetical protein G9A89_020426 [Geosiphon pyriformis]|nr:hypothetical protein G9A89_020426 [Geosiphon pyriformis]
MGIPGFFRWLASHYPQVVERVVPNSRHVTDFLYLDINALFHSANLAKSKKKGSKRKLTPGRMLAKVFQKMDEAIDLCNPQALVYIAMDGVAPRAKMNEQRVRRYLAVNIKPKNPAIVPPIGIPSSSQKLAVANEDAITIEVGGDNEDNGGFFLPGESVAITPGTPFMKAANEAIRYYIYQRLNGYRRHMQIIFSDSSVPGEGEHKLFHFLKSQRIQRSYNIESRHIVCGGDADFIMYSLMTHEQNIRILRPGMGTELDILHIQHLRKHLINDMKPKEKVSLTLEEQENIIEDFVCISMLLGNDFLPKLQGLGTAVNVMMRTYRGCFEQMGGYITQKGGKINIGRLITYIFNLGDKTEILGEKLSQISQKHSKISEEEAVKRANDYVRVLCWAFQYYTRDCPSWRFFYPHHFPPSILELVKHVKSQSVDQNFTADLPMRPFEQLICVLPRSCENFLPDPLRDLISDPKSSLAEFFPDRMQLVSGVGILPFIDEKKLWEAMKPRLPLLNSEDSGRNTIDGKVHFYAGVHSPTHGSLRAMRMNNLEYTQFFPMNKVFGKLINDGPTPSTIVTPIKKWGDLKRNSVVRGLYQLPILPSQSDHVNMANKNIEGVPLRSKTPPRATPLPLKNPSPKVGPKPKIIYSVKNTVVKNPKNSKYSPMFTSNFASDLVRRPKIKSHMKPLTESPSL